METLIYVANLLYLFSYFVQDILRLRLLTVIATSCLAVYFGAHVEPMTTIVAWNLFFVGLNLLQIARILAHRRKHRASGTRTTQQRLPAAGPGDESAESAAS